APSRAWGGKATRVQHQYALRTQSETITATARYADGTWAAYVIRLKLVFRDPQAGFVADRFYALTGTAIDAGRLRQWTRLMHAGMKAEVLALMRMSAGYHSRLVRNLYRRVLHRNPTKAELRWALSLFPQVPLLGSAWADGGWGSVEPVIRN